MVVYSSDFKGNMYQVLEDLASPAGSYGRRRTCFIGLDDAWGSPGVAAHDTGVKNLVSATALSSDLAIWSSAFSAHRRAASISCLQAGDAVAAFAICDVRDSAARQTVLSMRLINRRAEGL